MFIRSGRLSYKSLEFEKRESKLGLEKMAKGSTEQVKKKCFKNWMV